MALYKRKLGQKGHQAINLKMGTHNTDKSSQLLQHYHMYKLRVLICFEHF